MNRSKSLQLPFLIASLMLAVVAGAAERSRPSEYEILRSFPPGRLAALSSGDKPDANGFTGGNRANGFWIEVGPQRGSCRGVIAAVVAGDLAAADACWRGIDVAFAHQRADGGFDAIVKPNGTSSREGPAAVETAYFFLQELGRAILVIRESPYESHFHERLVALRPKLRLAADFLLAGYSTIIPKVGHTVNRVIIAAKAFGLCGLAVGLGARLPNYQQRSANRIASGLGGTVNLIASIALVTAVVVLMGLVCYRVAIVLESPQLDSVGYGLFAVMALLGLGAGLVAMRIGAAAFRKAEF